MDISNLDSTVITWRRKVNSILGVLRKEKDPEVLNIAKKMLRVDTALIELLMVIMYYKTRPEKEV